MDVCCQQYVLAMYTGPDLSGNLALQFFSGIAMKYKEWHGTGVQALKSDAAKYNEELPAVLSQIAHDHGFPRGKPFPRWVVYAPVV